jgi:hypothetical protein
VFIGDLFSQRHGARHNVARLLRQYAATADTLAENAATDGLMHEAECLVQLGRTAEQITTAFAVIDSFSGDNGVQVVRSAFEDFHAATRDFHRDGRAAVIRAAPKAAVAFRAVADWISRNERLAD